MATTGKSKAAKETKTKKPAIRTAAPVGVKSKARKAAPAAKTPVSPAAAKSGNQVTEKVLKDVATPKPSGGNSLTAQVYDVNGKADGSVDLPADLFNAHVNAELLAQAVRVYLASQRVGHASTKTRGEVEGSTRKLFSQKGTGRARHGSVRAPIFVKGGIVFGPKPRDYSLSLPDKMKTRAYKAALTNKWRAGEISFVSGLDKVSKTKQIAKLLSVVATGAKRVLLVYPASATNIYKAARNIGNVTVMNASSVHPYAVMSHSRMVILKDAIAELVHTNNTSK